VAILLKADGGVEEIRPADGRTFVLDELQALVGGFIEVVRARDGRWLVINEDGKRQNLQLNVLASIKYKSAGVARPSDVIVGDVLLADNAEMGADEDDAALARELADRTTRKAAP
jgi:hypothetical protein